MSDDDDMELEEGSDNVFADFSYPDAEILAVKAELAARIIGELDDQKLSVREAGKLAGVNFADISRIRNARYDQFTIDWLARLLISLKPELKISLNFNGATDKAA